MCEITNNINAFSIDNFKLDKNYVIEASAGTGKTYTIVEIVKKLIESGVKLDEIMLLTYTDKAAGELKDRIRKGCKEKELDVDVDNATIGTIHSFCKGIIETYPILSDNASDKKLIGENELKNFIKRYIRKGEIYEDICKFKEKHSDDVEGIEEKLYAYLNKYYLDKNGEEVPEIIAFDEDDERIRIEKYIFENGNLIGYDDINDSLNVIRNSVYQYHTNTNQHYLRELYDVLHNSEKLEFNATVFASNKSDMCQEEKYAINYIKNFRDKIKKYDISDVIIFKHLTHLYLAWQKEKENLCAQTYNDMLRNVREAVLEENSELCAKLREKYKYAIIDEFQDTNQIQWDIFKKVFLKDDGHHIIVVGDPKQSIYAFQGADINVYQKAKGEIRDRDGSIESLDTNYRSTEDIITSTGEFFKNETALSNEFERSYSPDQNKFEVKYKGEDTKAFWITKNVVSAEEYAEIICQQIVDCCTKNERGETNLRVNEKTKIENSEFLQDNWRNVSFKDFTILYRTRSESIAVISAFEKYGIPYQKYKDKDLFTGKECANWIAILEAINKPNFMGRNRSAFKKALFTYFFNYKLDELASDKFDGDSLKELNLFDDWREFVYEKNWGKLIDSIIDDTKISLLMSSPEKLKAYGNLIQIGDYCIDYLNRTNSIELLIDNLRKQAKGTNDEDGDDGENLIAKSTDFDCVKLMTIHASKGLEFSVVISVAGLKGPNNQATNAYSYHNEGQHLLIFENNNTCKAEEENELKRLFYVAYTRAKYILMLPQFACPKKGNGEVKQYKFISESILEYKNKNNGIEDESQWNYRPLKKENISFKDLKDKVNVILESNVENNNAGIDITTKEEQEAKIKNIRDTIYFRGSHKHAYSSLSHGGAIKETTMSDSKINLDNAEETDSIGLAEFDENAKPVDCDYNAKMQPAELSKNFPAGAGLGNALHNIFEVIDYKANYDQSDNKDSLAKLTEGFFKAEGIRFHDEWNADINTMVKNVLSAKMPEIQGANKTDESFSLSEISFTDRRNETEFNFNKEGEKFNHFFNGFVDLIFKRGEYYSILDWKSDRLSDDFTAYNEKDTLKKHVDELYSIQRVLYSYCLIKWLKNFYKDKSEEDIFNEHFGGIYYVFLRGCNEGTGNGIYAQTWESYDALKEAYDKIVKEKVH